MTKTRYTHDPVTNEWVFPDGKRLPMISGGDPTADPAVVVVETPAPAPVVVVPDNTVITGEPPRFTAEDIENARKQEKEKLYPRIDKLSEQLDIFTKEREEQQRLQAEAAQRADEDRRRSEEEELGLKDLLFKKEDEWKSTFNTAQEEWAQKFAALEEEKNAHAALLEIERRYQEVTSYKNRRIQEEGDNLMPELLDFVTGDTEEAIEASISAVAARTSAIVENIQQATATSRQVLRPVPATGSAPTSGPQENTSEQRTYTMADLKNMDMSTYAAERDRLMAAVRR